MCIRHSHLIISLFLYQARESLHHLRMLGIPSFLMKGENFSRPSSIFDIFVSIPFSTFGSFIFKKNVIYLMNRRLDPSFFKKNVIYLTNRVFVLNYQMEFNFENSKCFRYSLYRAFFLICSFFLCSFFPRNKIVRLCSQLYFIILALLMAGWQLNLVHSLRIKLWSTCMLIVQFFITFLSE